MNLRKREEHVNHERWLISYADLITLLFALFVVLYALSQADMQKFKKVSESMKAAFSGKSAARGAGDEHGSPDSSDPSDPMSSADPAGAVPGGATAVPPPSQDTELQDIKEMLDESFATSASTHSASATVESEFTDEGLLVRIAASQFFDPGVESIRPDLLPLLDKIGRILAKSPTLIRIEGHCDPEEVAPEKLRARGRFRNAWELSTARATWVANRWTERLRMDPARLHIAGFGEHRVIDTADTSWGRAKNRRVEFLVLRAPAKKAAPADHR